MRIRWLKRLALFTAGLAVGAAALPLFRPAVHRSPAAAGADALSEAELALDRPVPEVWIDGVPLDEAIDRLRPAAGVPIDVDWRALALVAIDRKTPVTARYRNARLGDVLDRLFEQAFTPQGRAGAAADGERILISTGEALAARHVLRMYDVRDLAPPGLIVQGYPVFGEYRPLGRQIDDAAAGDVLRKVIEEIVAPDSWREVGGSIGSIIYLDGRLVVVQTPHNHRLIGNLLAELRAQPAVPRATAGPPEPGRVVERWDADFRRWMSTDTNIADAALRRVLPEVEIDAESLEEAIEQLSRVSGAAIRVDREAVAFAEGPAATLRRIAVRARQATLAEALRAVLDASPHRPPLTWWLDGEVITVTTRHAVADHRSTEVYDVTDWLRAAGVPVPTQPSALRFGTPEPDEVANAHGLAMDGLITAIRAAVDMDIWRDAGAVPGLIRELNGQLFVTQTWENQERVRRILQTHRPLPSTRPGGEAASQPTSRPSFPSTTETGNLPRP